MASEAEELRWASPAGRLGCDGEDEEGVTEACRFLDVGALEEEGKACR